MTDREAVKELRRCNQLYLLLKPLTNEEIASYSKELEDRLEALAAAGFDLKFIPERYIFREPAESLSPNCR
jgi:hypothetical protein